MYNLIDMKKYLLTIEFRYHKVPESELYGSYTTTKKTIGVYDNFEDACTEGNKILEIMESKYELNKNWNKKERFSKNGGAFGSPNRLISNLAYLRTPYEFYFKIETLDIMENFNDCLNSIHSDIKNYRQWKKNNDE